MTWQTFKIWYFQFPWLIAAFFAIIGLAFVPGAPRVMRFACHWMSRLARRPWRAVVIVLIISTLALAFPWMIGKTRPPDVHDEMSYLLAADTFLHGRLTNPTPPFWRNFQTFHELMHPTYASKYPPAQGIALAIGKLSGSFHIGAILPVALACAATTWMLMACMPRRWAIVGGLLAAFHPQLFYWAQIFWGGGVSMLGGAIVGGATLRVDRVLGYIAREKSPSRERIRSLILYGAIGGLSAGVLVNTRPYESLLLLLLMSGWIVTRMILRRARPVPIVYPLAAAILVLIPIFAWMGYYNYRVTGKATRMPYTEHLEQYAPGKVFFWDKEHLPTMGVVPPHMSWFIYGIEINEYQEQQTWAGLRENAKRKLLFIGRDAFVPIPMLIVMLAGLPIALMRWRAARFAALAVLGLIFIHMVTTYYLRTHYLGPVAAFFILGLTCALHALNIWRPLGRPLGTAAAIAMLIILPIAAFRFSWRAIDDPLNLAREKLKAVEHVEKNPGKHLVFVVYANTAQQLFEWVSNSADIDGQRVIFANPLDDDAVRMMRRHYPDRSIWLLNVANVQWQLQPVVGPETPPR